MLDRTSRTVIKFMQKSRPNMNDGLFTIDFISIALNMTHEEVEACIDFLEKSDYLRVVRREGSLSAPVLWGIELTHNGRHYREFTWISMKLYLLDKWIDFLALVVAIIALVFSIIAISKP